MRGAEALRAWARRWTADVIHTNTERIRRAGAIGPDCARGRRFRSFGENSCISYPAASIFGEAYIEIGTGTMIGSDVTLSAGFGPGHDLGDRAVVRIGDRVVLGRGSHVVAHAGIEVGDDVYTGPHVYITDQNHTYRDPELPIGRQWPTEQPVSIGPGSWIGTGAVILPGAELGRNVVVAAGAVVRGQIPDHSVAAGVPARIVRRWDAEEGWLPPIPPSADELEMDEDERIRLAEVLGIR